MLKVINRTLGQVVNRLRLTLKVIATLGSNGLLVSGTLLILISQAHRWVWLWHRIDRLLSRVNRLCRLSWLNRLTWLCRLTWLNRLTWLMEDTKLPQLSKLT